MTVYEYQNKILIVDAGMMFPDNDMIGIDYIIPDFDYVVQRADQVVGIVITHGHEDHTGAIGHLMEQCQRADLRDSAYQWTDQKQTDRRNFSKDANLINVRAGESVQIGPFKVDFSMSVIPCRMALVWGSRPRSDWSFIPVIINLTILPVDGLPTRLRQTGRVCQPWCFGASG